MLRLRLYRDRLFRITSLQLTAARRGFVGTLFLVPLLLQNGLGFSAVHSGLSTFTEALGGMIGVQVTTRLYKRVGPRRLMIAGMCGTVASIGLMALAGPSDAAWLIPLLMFFTGCSFGFAISPSQAANMATITAAETGHASTLLNTAQAGGRGGRGRAARHRARRDRRGRGRPGRLPARVPRRGRPDGRSALVFCRLRQTTPTPRRPWRAAAGGAPAASGSCLTRPQAPVTLIPVVTADGAALSLSLTRAMLSRFPLIDGHNDLPWEIREKFGSDLDRR